MLPRGDVMNGNTKEINESISRLISALENMHDMLSQYSEDE